MLPIIFLKHSPDLKSQRLLSPWFFLSRRWPIPMSLSSWPTADSNCQLLLSLAHSFVKESSCRLVQQCFLGRFSNSVSCTSLMCTMQNPPLYYNYHNILAASLIDVLNYPFLQPKKDSGVVAILWLGFIKPWRAVCKNQEFSLFHYEIKARWGGNTAQATCHSLS